jgi:hypothetical protein
MDFKNLFNKICGRYTGHEETIIISCHFNPMGSPYRLKVFNQFHNTIKHLPHHIVECVIGDGKPELKGHQKQETIYTQSLLWHKEALLNRIVENLPPKYKYVLWVDADVLFTNKNWVAEAAEKLSTDYRVVQLFGHCVHLEKDEIKPSFDFDSEKVFVGTAPMRHPKVWRGFAANYVLNSSRANSINYDVHGHVGFAWGARREVLERVPLYDKALIGGADHIFAHAAVGQIPHSCIEKAFKADLDGVLDWSDQLFEVTKGSLGYVSGDLYHLWHGDIDRRQYLKRIQDFTAMSRAITKKDANGLYVAEKESGYIKEYFKNREVDKNGLHAPPRTIPLMKKEPVRITLPAKPLAKVVKPTRKAILPQSKPIRINTTSHSSTHNDNGNLLANYLIYNSVMRDSEQDNSQPAHHHNDRCDHNNDGVPDNLQGGGYNSDSSGNFS